MATFGASKALKRLQKPVSPLYPKAQVWKGGVHGWRMGYKGSFIRAIFESIVPTVMCENAYGSVFPSVIAPESFSLPHPFARP